MSWTKEIDGKRYCKSCGLGYWRKPQNCNEPKHQESWEKYKKINYEYRKKRRKTNPYFPYVDKKEIEKFKEKKRIYARDRQQEWRAIVIKKLGNKCNWCGCDDYRVLIVDHYLGEGREEKRKYGWSYWKKHTNLSINELKVKLQVLCANCHAIKTWKEREEKRKTMKPKRVCTVKGCNKRYLAKGLCRMHYTRKRTEEVKFAHTKI